MVSARHPAINPKAGKWRQAEANLVTRLNASQRKKRAGAEAAARAGVARGHASILKCGPFLLKMDKAGGQSHSIVLTVRWHLAYLHYWKQILFLGLAAGS